MIASNGRCETCEHDGVIERCRNLADTASNINGRLTANDDACIFIASGMCAATDRIVERKRLLGLNDSSCELLSGNTDVVSACTGREGRGVAPQYCVNGGDVGIFDLRL